MRRRSVSPLPLCLGGLLMLAVAGCQAAPTPVPVDHLIAFGQTAQGSLSQTPNRWLFIGSHADTISIEFTSTGAPPSIALIGPDGESIARVSESGHLDKFRLPDDGQFAIVVGSGQGDYALILQRIPPGSLLATAPAVTPQGTAANKAIGVGDSHLGALAGPDALDLWTLQANAGDVVSLQMKALSSGLDPVLSLFAPDGSLLISDDSRDRSSQTGGGVALISGIKLPTTGPYLIQSSSHQQNGDYVLTVQAGLLPTPTFAPRATIAGNVAITSPTSIAGETPTAAPVVQSGTVVRVGETVQSAISDPQQVDRFAIFGAAGSVISVGIWPAPASKLVPSFIMYAPDGKQAASAVGANGAVVSAYTLPSTGAYILYIHGNQNQSIGGYTLSVGDGQALRDLVGGQMQPEASYQGNLQRSGDRQNWTIDLPANATLALEADPGTAPLQPLFDIVGPNGKRLATSTSDPVSHIARIAGMVTPQQGRYTIRVNAAPGKDVGSYTLTPHIVHIEPTATFSAPLDQNIQAEVVLDGRYNFTLKGQPGLIVVVEAHGKADFDPVIELYGPSGRRLAFVDDSTAGSPDALLQTSLDDGVGAYTIQVHGYAMTPGAFVLHIKTE